MSQGYPAAKAELQPGDVIRAVNLKPATDLEEFVKLYDTSTKARDSRVLLVVLRGRGRRSAIMKVTYQPDPTTTTTGPATNTAPTTKPKE
jgi:S1-C subfamily serine protease